MKTALIFGITGQDGSYLAELLLSKGYRVIGVSRRSSTSTDERIRHLYGNPNFRVLPGDITDAFCVHRLNVQCEPDEIFNLAAQSHVAVSFGEPSHTTDVDYRGPLNILESMRILRGHLLEWGITQKFYQASSSEMFGSSVSTRERESCHGCVVEETYQDESTPFLPNSPYAIAKLAAHHLVRVYRESYGLFACSGILFNHESPRRGAEFVTRKITKYLAEFRRHTMKTGQSGGFAPLKLGNLTAERDWGFAGDYVEAMWLMLQDKTTPDEMEDFVIATGETHTVDEFLTEAFKVANLQQNWTIDRTLFRPCEVPYLCGDSSKARQKLGWKPKVGFKELVKMMVEADISEMFGPGKDPLGYSDRPSKSAHGQKFLICPDCGMATDGNAVHGDKNGKDCLTVKGRRGWRKLGDYDG